MSTTYKVLSYFFFNVSGLWLLFLKDFIYLFLERGEGWEKVRERNTNVWLPFMRPLLGTWPATQAYAWLGIKPATFWFAGWCSIHWATPARGWATSHRYPLLYSIFTTTQGGEYNFTIKMRKLGLKRGKTCPSTSSPEAVSNPAPSNTHPHSHKHLQHAVSLDRTLGIINFQPWLYLRITWGAFSKYW